MSALRRVIKNLALIYNEAHDSKTRILIQNHQAVCWLLSNWGIVSPSDHHPDYATRSYPGPLCFVLPASLTRYGPSLETLAENCKWWATKTLYIDPYLSNQTIFFPTPRAVFKLFMRQPIRSITGLQIGVEMLIYEVVVCDSHVTTVQYNYIVLWLADIQHGKTYIGKNFMKEQNIYS